MHDHELLYGIIGYPIEFSLSPVMHNTAFRALGINASYRLFPVQEKNFDQFFAELREPGSRIFGLNVTVPYKEKVIYPGLVPEVGKYLKGNLTPATRTIFEFENRIWNKEALRELLSPVQRLLKDGKSLYCGEFGVYEQAPRETRLNWTRDVVSLFTELGVGWSYWNYKWLDFGVWPQAPEGQTAALDQEMLQILQTGIK